MNYNISVWLEPELLEFYNVANSVQNSAQFVQNLPANKATLKTQAGVLADEYNNKYNNWKAFFPADKDSSIAHMEQRITTGKWTTFAFDIVLWLVTIVALVLAFGGAKNRKTVLTMGVLGTLFMLIISIAFLYYMWGIAALSGGCNIAKELIKGNAKVLEDIDASDEFKSFANECFFSSNANIYSQEQLNNQSNAMSI